MNEEKRAHMQRAVDRAKAILKPGDIITCTRCACNAKPRTYIFDSFDGNWLRTKSGLTDLHAYYISGLNGDKTFFRDPGANNFRFKFIYVFKGSVQKEVMTLICNSLIDALDEAHSYMKRNTIPDWLSVSIHEAAR